MKKGMRIILFMIMCAVATASLAQRSISIENPEVERLIKEDIQHLYNTEIEESKRLNAKIRELLPDHPVNPLLEALAIRAAYQPMEPESPEMAELKKDLYEVVKKAEVMLDKDDDDPEANFFAMAGYGLLAVYEKESGNSMKALSQAKDAYGYLKNGMEMQDEYVEFYFSTGLYNYYRERYPEVHSFYRPFMWFFKSGDKALGLKQVKKAEQESIFMEAEAADYLAHIYLYYENKPKQALVYARKLVNQYPKNLYFNANFLNAALTADNYQNLETPIERLVQNDRPYYQMAGHLFEGMLLEKRDQNYDEAEQQYVKSLEIGTGLKSEEAENYRSYAYAGLARIAHQEKKYAQARNLYEKALSSARYQVVEQEAKKYLN